jgi:hypothetical protein
MVTVRIDPIFGHMVSHDKVRQGNHVSCKETLNNCRYLLDKVYVCMYVCRAQKKTKETYLNWPDSELSIKLAWIEKLTILK